MFSDPAVCTCLAEEAGVAVGWISFGKSRDEDAVNCGEVYGLHAHPDHWGHRIGGELMKRAEEELTTQGCQATMLWVLELNVPARPFCTKSGYAFDGTRKELMIGGKELSEVR